MRRLRQRQAEAVAEALRYIPSRFHDALGHDLFCADPIFAGLYIPAYANESTQDGRNYRRIAHVGWCYHTRDRRTTVVWPSMNETPWGAVLVAVHELGHVLHEHLAGRIGWSRMPTMYPVSDYGKTNYIECFAEAFTAFVLQTPRMMDEHSYWLGYSRSNAEWFDRLFAA